MAATEPIRDKAQLRSMADYYLKKGQIRNYTLIVMGVETALRISDLLKLRWDDVYDETQGSIRARLVLTEDKTGKSKSIPLNRQIVKALTLLREHRRGDYLFASTRRDARPIGRVQAWRIVRAAADAAGVDGKVSCHSLRKTFGYFAWTEGHVSPVVIMEIYNHSSYETTRRYLGVSQDDLDKAYLSSKLLI